MTVMRTIMRQSGWHVDAHESGHLKSLTFSAFATHDLLSFKRPPDLFCQGHGVCRKKKKERTFLRIIIKKKL